MFIQLIFIVGTLVQVSNNGNTCPYEVAVFKCSHTFTNWEIQTPGDSVVPVSFNKFDYISQRFTINSSKLLFEITYNNESFIIVTLTITKPLNINGAIVKCNSEMIELSVRNEIGKSSYALVNMKMLLHPTHCRKCASIFIKKWTHQYQFKLQK